MKPTQTANGLPAEHPISVRVDKETWRALRVIAAENDTTMSEMLRKYAETTVARNKAITTGGAQFATNRRIAAVEK
ncbi:hypothetical protein WS75_19915 [Burkholderia sp. FL-7-2-10-S1-D7]|uniref:ribbon-helix-helix protein, CopG family n=1 Tax=Burkholderia sp. FL-7-2-10-S1-D7 TaxID=1637866 RepID=UPI00075AD295|nr:ribbon-helix-helix protein, CopG family [Burkholderia sp. FL-7-2-10-S1-D7]KVF71979.1 hypothetical protein WS75_19915 [Burkholderia sp. FL-7-2-10-S1-D7]